MKVKRLFVYWEHASVRPKNVQNQRCEQANKRHGSTSLYVTLAQ